MAQKNNIVIAGGAGFVGSHLCEFYLQRGDSVICVDNLSTGSKQNIEHLQDNADFRFVQADIVTDMPVFADESITHVLNLASPASPPHYQRLAIETLQVGSIGTFHMLELARTHNARFFHASTSEVYGDPTVHPQPESYWGNVNSYGPRSMYDEAKRYAEALIYSYRQKYNISTCTARFFNTYGPHMDPKDGRVVSNFIVQALQGRDLTIYGEGKQTRSFCYVEDLVRGITALIDSTEEGPMNLGNPGEFTVAELADIVIELTGTTAKVTYEALPRDDPMQRQPDISYAKKSLGWEPKIALRDGLLQTIEYFKTRV